MYGWSNVTVIASNAQIAPILTQLDPDLILIDLANPDRNMLEHLSLTSQAKTRPVAMFVDHTDQAMTKATIDAGVSAYVVGGLHKGRIKPVLETAIVRLQAIQKMQTELNAAKRALTDRKTIERAKGLLTRARYFQGRGLYPAAQNRDGTGAQGRRGTRYSGGTSEMKTIPVTCGYLPLVGSAADNRQRSCGSHQRSGLDLTLAQQPSLSALPDRLAFGALDFAHLLSPMPIAMALGFGTVPAKISALLCFLAMGQLSAFQTILGRPCN